MQGPTITITVPAFDVDDAVEIRDRIKGLILVQDETAVIVNGGVAIRTTDLVRVVNDLSNEGFF